MAITGEFKGTSNPYFKIGKGGPRLKNNSNVLEVKDTTDNSYSNLKCGALDVTNPTTTRSNLKVPATDPTGITGATAVSNIVYLTQANYNSITPNSSTIYFIID